MKNTVIKIAMTGSLIAGTMSLTACSDEELALGAGVIIGVIIADDSPHERPAPYPDHGHRHDRHRGGRYHDHSLMAVSLIATPDFAASEEDLVAANHLNLEVQQAQVVMDALKSAQNQDFTALTELGITKTDLRKMAVGENPSATALRTLALELGLELGETHDLIQTLKADLAQGLNQ